MGLVLVFLAHRALAQDISINLGDGQSFSLRTSCDHAAEPRAGLAIMVTCFPFMWTCFLIWRQATACSRRRL